MECGVDAHAAPPMKNRLEEEIKIGFITRMFRSVSTLLLKLHMNLKDLCWKMLKLARDDPRRVYHSCKVGMALTIVSILYFIWPLNASMANNFIWAVMTVAVVFEYTVGGTLSKGLNRGFATLLAGALGIGVHYLGRLSGEQGEPIILGVFVFLLAAAATFSRFFPGIKARYDYGVLIFILTFCLVAVTGYREDELFKVAVERLGTVAIGGAICMLVSILICPVWAGADLHKSIVNNLNKVAESLEGCMEEYLNDGEGEESKTRESSIQGYRTVLDSKTKEESLTNFARWEPPHGKFGIGHPWKQYLKVGAMTRKCAYCVEALDAWIRSDSKAHKALSRHLQASCLNVTSLSSELLRELSTVIDTMSRSSKLDYLIEKINIGIEDLSTALKLLPHVDLYDHNTDGTAAHASTYIIDIIPFATVTTILTETVGRIEGIISAVNELSVHAKFKYHVSSYAVGCKSTIKSQKNAAVNPLGGKEGPHVIVIASEAPLSGT